MKSKNLDNEEMIELLIQNLEVEMATTAEYRKAAIKLLDHFVISAVQTKRQMATGESKSVVISTDEEPIN